MSPVYACMCACACMGPILGRGVIGFSYSSRRITHNILSTLILKLDDNHLTQKRIRVIFLHSEHLLETIAVNISLILSMSRHVRVSAEWYSQRTHAGFCLFRPAVLDDFVSTIDLPNYGCTIPEKTTCSVYGWGYTGRKLTFKT